MYKGPRVLKADELLEKALHRAAKLTRSGNTRDQRERNTAIARVRAATDILAGDLAAYVKGFPSLGQMHPFYRELLPSLLDVDRLKHAIGAADWASTKVRQVSRDSVRALARSDPAELLMLKRGAFGRITSVVKQIREELETLASAAAALRRIPSIDVESPTIVVAGAPNVGKSQLVRKMSSGKPEVAAYPFTTKAITVGHFEESGIRYQVLDTPGLLDRPAEARNPIERQAAAALRHLAHAILFILDPTETCGTLIEDQLKLEKRVLKEFPDIPVLGLENKGDLLSTATRRRRVSALTGAGVETLRRLAAATARKKVAQ